MMGPKEERPAILYFLSDDGKFQRIGKLEDVTLLGEPQRASEFESLKQLGEVEVTGTMKIPRCRTRKRYVKLLMAFGKSKNFANRQADICHARGDTWQQAWIRLLYFYTCAQITAEVIAGILPKPMPEEERKIKCLQE